MNTELPALHIPAESASCMQNFRTFEGAIQKRWGYSTAYRSTGNAVQYIVIYEKTGGTRRTLYLCEKDVCKEEVSTNTFSYITPVYTTGTITSITGAAVVGDGTNWLTSGLNSQTATHPGDKFILTLDHSSSVEPDANWATILTVVDDTHITLTASYGSTAATFPGAAYKGRIHYQLPANTRWSYAVVNDIFCFTNGNDDVQKYTGGTYASAIDSTNAVAARYCIEYANRLVLADMKLSGIRSPYTIKWSKEGDPTTWTGTTAGESDLLQTEDVITGMGRAGSSLIVYKRDSVVFGEMTGESTAPIIFPTQKRGIGCVAPWSIVEVMGTNVWVWKDDFYIMSGQDPMSLSTLSGKGNLRNRFLDITDKTEIERTWGFHNPILHEVVWMANTLEGPIGFVWNYRDKEWYEYIFSHEVSGYGKGAI